MGCGGEEWEINVKYRVVTRKFGVEEKSGKWKFGVGSEMFEGKCEMQRMSSEEQKARELRRGCACEAHVSKREPATLTGLTGS